MSKEEQVKYDKYLETFAVSESEIRTARYEGREEGKTEMILSAYKKGLPISIIADIADQTENEVNNILLEHGLLRKS